MTLTADDIAQMQSLEDSFMPNEATILVSTRTKNSSGNTITTYAPTGYDEDLALPCRVAAGMPRSEEVRLGDTLATTQVWTVTFPAGTAIKNADRVWVRDWPKAITVQAIADGGDYETAVVVVCAEVWS